MTACKVIEAEVNIEVSNVHAAEDRNIGGLCFGIVV